MDVSLKPIGIVRTEATDIPRHYSVSEVEGKLEILKEYTGGLGDIRTGDRIVVLFLFHKSPKFTPDLLRQTPRGKNQKKGVFSICSPVRPNPIGMSILEVVGIEGTVITVRGLDMLDQTPILDIKPFHP